MFNILFWNLAGNNQSKDKSDYIINALRVLDIDIAFFAEIKGTDFNKVVNLCSGYKLLANNGGCEKITAIIRDTVHDAKVIFEHTRYCIASLTIHGTNYIVASTHLEDRYHTPQPSYRIRTIQSLRNHLEEKMDSTSIDKAIIIGDFNANPYDPELLQCDSFNAVLFKDVIKHEDIRVVQGESYRRYYNPIIQYLSENPKMYGSYYSSIGDSSPVWHCLDQVLVNSELVDSIEDVRYLRQIGTQSLMAMVAPQKSISDHLPLFVKMR